MINLLPFLLTSLLSHASSWDELKQRYPLPQKITSEQYRHIRVEAETIQNFRVEKRGTKPNTEKVLISKTGFRAHFDLYFLPGSVLAPSFAELKFTARRENHQWQTLDWPAFPMMFLDVDTINSIVSSGINKAIQNWSHPDIPVHTFPKDAITLFMHESPGGINKSFGRIGEMFENTLSGNEDANRRLPNFRSILFTIALAADGFEGQTENFPVEFDINYSDLDFRERLQSVRHSKKFTGKAQVVPLTPESMEKVEQMLQLHSCNSAMSTGNQSN